MNREIMFRIHATIGKEEIQLHRISLSMLLASEKGLGLKKYKVDQFTGLQDKKGRDIYEGDILEWPHVSSPSDSKELNEWYVKDRLRRPERYLYVVIFDEGGFGIKRFPGKGAKTYPLGHITTEGKNKNHASNYVVLGNTYENPELLHQPN